MGIGRQAGGRELDFLQESLFGERRLAKQRLSLAADKVEAAQLLAVGALAEFQLDLTRDLDRLLDSFLVEAEVGEGDQGSETCSPLRYGLIDELFGSFEWDADYDYKAERSRK